MKKLIGRGLGALAMCALLYGVYFSQSLPEEITLLSGREHSTSIAQGVRLSGLPAALEASAGTVAAAEAGEYEAELTAFGGMARKRVSVRVVEPRNLEIGGSLVGIKLRGAGVIVIGREDYCRTDVSEGDIIYSVNGAAINEYSDFAAAVDEGGEISLGVRRGDAELTVRAEPVLCEDGESRLGVWVRDSAAGVGTLTFIDRESGVYGALGHGINESETGVRFPVRKGTVERSRVAGVTKGRRGAPGEITGAFVGGAETLGTIELNSDCGIFGRLLGGDDASPSAAETLPAAPAGDVEIGPAQIICDVGEGRTSYEVAIMRVNRLGSPTKGILLQITDERLLALTGGIVQGMSGSPIIQNGAIVGAVTHVLVNNPACGYGVFIENMLRSAEDAA